MAKVNIEKLKAKVELAESKLANLKAADDEATRKEGALSDALWKISNKATTAAEKQDDKNIRLAYKRQSKINDAEEAVTAAKDLVFDAEESERAAAAAAVVPKAK